MVWFLERGDSQMACELRRSDRSRNFEFEVQGDDGHLETLACESPTDLIEAYLQRHAQLSAQGWRARPAPVVMFV